MNTRVRATSQRQGNSGPAAASTPDVSAKSRRALGSESATLIDSTDHYDERGSQEMEGETPACVGRYAGIIPTLFNVQHVRIWISGLDLDDGGITTRFWGTEP